MQYKYQIFLSSTYKDLIEERNVTINKIMKLHQIPAGMELFGAMGVKQWEYIKREINNSDYYLLIVAGKYGSENENGISYTEAEFDYACKSGKHIVAFLIKDVNTLPQEKCEMRKKQRDKLLKFRAKVEREAGLVAYWTDIFNLSAQIGESLANVMRDYPAKTKWLRIEESEWESPEQQDIHEYDREGKFHTLLLHN